MRRILIVEDEFFLLESMVKFMDGLENVRTRGCANLREALSVIESRPPDLIFSDINLPDGSGLEMINLLADKGLQIPLIFVSAYISDYRSRIPPDSNIMVLEKPVSMKRLREIAREKLEKDNGDYVFKLSDYLQIAAMGGHTVRLQCGAMGEITMVDGELWSAHGVDGDEGEAAFKRLVAGAEVHGKTLDLSCKRLDEIEMGGRNISGSLDNLLLNAVFEEEESLRYGQAEESGVGTPAETHDFKTLMDMGIEKLLSKEYTDALTLFTRAHKLEPDNRTVKTNIERLNQMGYMADSDKEAS